MTTKQTIYFAIILLFCGNLLCSQVPNIPQQDQRSVWVNAKLGGMTIEQKIGQLMMIRAHSDLGADHIKSVKNLIEKYEVGSLCFFQGTPEKQAQLTNEYQTLSKVPLLVAIDGEWGLGMRFKKDIISYPRQLTLGAINNNKLIYEMGRNVAYELKRIGIHINFAPVVDINNNPRNPVINNRSFGEDRENVTAKSYSYMQGMQDGGIIACAKHFPGHGDTEVDSHFGLPVIPYDYERLDSLEMYPFKMMINKGVESIMVAHLQVPSLDNRPNRPTSLSENTIKNVLRNNFGFDGLVITDGMEMEAVTKHFPPGVAEAEAILAGNDIICLPRNVAQAVKAIKEYVDNGFITEDQVDESVRRILGKKYDLGLNTTPRIVINDLYNDINHTKGKVLKAKLFQEAITLAQDSFNIIPYSKLSDIKFLTLAFGANNKSAFQKRVDSYTDAMHFNVPYNVSKDKMDMIMKEIKAVDHVIISAQDMSKYASKNFGLTKNFHKIIKKIARKKDVTIVLFGSPYSLEAFDDFHTVVVSYTDDELMQDKTAQALFGAQDIRGRLPVTASDKYKFFQGIQRSSIQKMGFATPEEVGMNSDSLLLIDEIVEEMIKTKAAPGCQVLVAKDGKIILNKAYGTHDYNKNNPVGLDDVYDVASITKIAASTISIMRLCDEKKLSLDDNLQGYVAGIDTTNKKDKTIRDMMSHHAGLAGWIPFYVSTIDPKSKKKKTLDSYYRTFQSDSFNIQVASNLYMRTDYVDTIWQRIINSDLRTTTKYKYSDLAFYFMMKVVEMNSQMSFDRYCVDNFYKPLGLTSTGFKPRSFASISNIVPSEKDNYFRNQVVKGHVHDMGAAMLGGVCGHAGLFSNSHDLAVIMQMLLNGGYYGGESYFSPQTVVEFTTRHPRSTRRGIGFDMKELNLSKHENMSTSASKSTFGHLGFTGTCAFADPENNLVYIFLSNRTYPSMENRKFGRKNYRPRIQTAIYNAMEKKS